MSSEGCTKHCFLLRVTVDDFLPAICCPSPPQLLHRVECVSGVEAVLHSSNMLVFKFCRLDHQSM